MKNKNCFIDCETTGLDYTKNGIIQIGAVIEIDGNIEAEINIKCQPFSFQTVSKDSLIINKTTIEEISTYMSPNEGYGEFVTTLDRFVNRYNSTDKFFFMGYNSFFDNMFLRKFFENNHDQYFSSYFWWPPVDVAVLLQEQIRKDRHKFINFKMETIAKLFGIESNIHDALSDAKVCREIYKKIMKCENK